MIAVGTLYFYVCAALALGGALAVVASKNPIRSAMGLLLLILSVAGLFLALHAQFLAAIQLIVYAGAIVVLFLFVIMLLGPSASPPSDQRGVVVRTFGGAVFALGGVAAIVAVAGAARAVHRVMPAPTLDPSFAGFGGIDAFGAVLFSDAVAPFELSGALLMVAVIGAVAVARGRQGIKALSRGEEEIAEAPMLRELPQEHSGVFRHDIEAHDAAESHAHTGASHPSKESSA
jgi:NADH-quinone oxidoreductase subunit J